MRGEGEYLALANTVRTLVDVGAINKKSLGDDWSSLRSQIDALERATAATGEAAEAHARHRDRARDHYASDELEIEDNCATSGGDKGIWVQAWVWLEHGEVDVNNSEVA